MQLRFGGRAAFLLSALGSLLVACIPEFRDTPDLAATSDLAARDFVADDLEALADLTRPDLFGADLRPALLVATTTTDHHFNATPTGLRATVELAFENQGDVATGLLGADLSGDDAFAVIDNTCDDVLDGSGACAVTIGFTPTSTTSASTTLTVGDGTLAATVTLDGSGITSCPAALAPATLVDVTSDGSTVALGASATVGTFTSPLFQTASVTSLSWRPSAPYGAALPNVNGTETTFDSENLNMSGNVLLLHFDEGPTATTFADGSQDSHPATCSTNCPTRGADGIFGRALQFNGDQFVVVDDHTDFAVSQFTHSSWFRITGDPTGNSGRIFGKGSQESAPYGTFAVDWMPENAVVVAERNHVTCGMALATSGGTTVISTTERTAASGWVHVTCRYNGSSFAIFLDGEPSGSIAVSPTGQSLQHALDYSNLVVGSWGIAHSGAFELQRFRGDIDEVALWNRALSDAEIRQLYRRGTQRLGIQLRACTEPTCNGNTLPFLGPDGTSATSWGEPCGPLGTGVRTIAIDGVDCNRDGMSDHAGAIFGAAPYWQYRVTLGAPNLLTPRPAFTLLRLCE